jgi:ribosomal-protein-serine acetyltransferase
MQPPEVMDAEMVTLRAWRPDDVDAMARAVAESVEHLRPWMPWVAAEPMPRDDRAALITELRRQRDAGETFVYGMFAVATGEPVGGTGLHARIGPGGLEIGYWVHPAWTGRGIATATTRVLTTLAFELAGIERVEVHHDKANVASPRIPEKLGYTLVAQVPRSVEAPGEVGIECQWRMTRQEWEGTL